MALTAIACGGGSVESLRLPDVLPTRIGGAEIVYDRVEGPDLPERYDSHLAVDVADLLDVRLDRVTFFSGFRDGRSTYNSDVVEIRDVATQALLDTVVIASTGEGERRVELIAGKSVIRAAPAGCGCLDEAPYFYAFDDAAFIFVGHRPFVEEALRSLP